LIAILVSVPQVLWYFSHGPTVTDLRIFMTGVDMVKSGHGHQLYHFDAQEKAQTNLYPETHTSGLLPFNHLAYELLFYWPVSALSYRAALIVWAVANLGLLFLIAWLLAPYSQNLIRMTGLPLSLYFLAFYPVMYMLGEGQDSLIFLLLLTLSLRAMDSDRSFLAGFLLALACFKFHLALLIAFFVLFLARKWRGVGGLITGAVLVAGISLAIVGPAIVHDYPAMLRQQEVMTPWGFVPWFMPNLRGLIAWALAPKFDAGMILPVVFMISAIVGIVSTWAVLRRGRTSSGDDGVRREKNDESLLYAFAVLTTLLISYHLHMQDLTLALLPMLVLVERVLRERRDVRMIWLAMFISSIGALYLYRIAAEAYPTLLLRGCFLALPLASLWLVALRAVGTSTTQDFSR
jgi:hypothetical protein